MSNLRDTLVGITAVIKPTFPKTKTVVTLLVGFFIGLIWAYALSPTVFYDGHPSQLHQSWQNAWVKLLADRYADANANVEEEIVPRLRAVDHPLSIVEALEAQGVQIDPGFRQLAQQAEPGFAAPEPNIIASIVPFIVAPILIFVLAYVLTVVWGLLISPFIDPYVRRFRHTALSTSDAAVAMEVQAIRAAKAAQASLKTDFSASDLGPPVMQRMSIYIRGRGQYDDSFSIEDANEMFLGECGASISETIGVGPDQKVTAIEIWLFDKEDFVRTITKVFASEFAFNDPALKAKLDAKGDVVLAKPGAIAVLDTNALQLQARIIEMSYAAGPEPPNSVFEKLTIELAVWQKAPGVAPVATQPAMAAPVGAAPASSYAPPPQPAAPTAPRPVTPATSGPGITPLKPQPIQTPPASRPSGQQEDDPFGGTGDFTPLGG